MFKKGFVEPNSWVKGQVVLGTDKKPIKIVGKYLEGCVTLTKNLCVKQSNLISHYFSFF